MLWLKAQYQHVLTKIDTSLAPCKRWPLFRKVRLMAVIAVMSLLMPPEMLVRVVREATALLTIMLAVMYYRKLWLLEQRRQAWAGKRK